MKGSYLWRLKESTSDRTDHRKRVNILGPTNDFRATELKLHTLRNQGTLFYYLDFNNSVIKWKVHIQWNIELGKRPNSRFVCEDHIGMITE